MNERIKQLMDLAELPLFDINGNCKYNDTYFDKEKFAELIVKECAGVNYNSPFQDGEFHAREVLEHFGVEE